MLEQREHNPLDRRFAGVVVIAIVCLAAAAGAATAAETAGPVAMQRRTDPTAAPKLLQAYDLSWWSVDGGGGTSSGGVFAVTGSLGQPDAGSAGGCGTAVAGGVWSGPEPCGTPLFCDGFESGDTGAWASVTP